MEFSPSARRIVALLMHAVKGKSLTGWQRIIASGSESRNRWFVTAFAEWIPDLGGTRTIFSTQYVFA